jgi:hypothetical protein
MKEAVFNLEGGTLQNTSSTMVHPIKRTSIIRHMQIFASVHRRNRHQVRILLTVSESGFYGITITYIWLNINDVILSEWLRNKSWKPECVGSFNMDWRILVFYPEPKAMDKIY